MTTDEHVARLEKTINSMKRTIRAFGIVVLAGGLCWGCMIVGTTASAEPENQEKSEAFVRAKIITRSIAIANSKGSPVAIIDSDDNGLGRFRSLNDKGKVTAMFGTAPNGGGYLAISGGSDELAVNISSLNSCGLIQLFGAKNETLVFIGSQKTEKRGFVGVISLLDQKGRPVVDIAPMPEEGQGAISLFDANSTELISLGALDHGGAITVRNKTGEQVVHILADEYGMGYVGAFDRQGKGRTLQPR